MSFWRGCPGLRRAQIGGRRARISRRCCGGCSASSPLPGSARAAYAGAATPVSQLINDFGPPVSSPALERQRAAMPFAYFERDLWDLRDRQGRQITPDIPETGRWLLDHGAAGQLQPEVTAVLADRATLAAAARLLLDQHFTPVLSEMICAAAGAGTACAGEAGVGEAWIGATYTLVLHWPPGVIWTGMTVTRRPRFMGAPGPVFMTGPVLRCRFPRRVLVFGPVCEPAAW